MIKGPVTKYLPGDCARIGFEMNQPVVKMHEWVRDPQNVAEDKPVVFVIGAFAHGDIDVAYIDKQIGVSQYPLSAACALARITNALEMKWQVV